MSRRNRLALLIAALLVVGVTGTVFATRQPSASTDPAGPAASQEAADEGPPDAGGIAHALDRLSANGITADEAQLTDLATRYGLGGAVRLVAWADETGMTVDELAAMRDGDGTPEGGMGWGRMAHELGVHPGLGAIMGNGSGGGRDSAPGQQNKAGEDDASGD